MASAGLNTDLTQLHRNIEQSIKTRFPAFKLVAFYRDEENDDIPTPACLLELDEISPNEEDPGTGQVIVGLKFSARILFSREINKNALLETRLACADMSAFINKNRWGGGVSPARIISCGPDYFKPDITHRYSMWLIEFHHTEAFFGTNMWANFREDNVKISEAVINGENHEI